MMNLDLKNLFQFTENECVLIANLTQIANWKIVKSTWCGIDLTATDKNTDGEDCELIFQIDLRPLQEVNNMKQKRLRIYENHSYYEVDQKSYDYFNYLVDQKIISLKNQILLELKQL